MLARNVSGDRLDEELILTLRNGGKRVRVIPLKELRKATNNFSEECQIGGGGFGKMYRGVVNGELVAIKKSELIGTEEAKTQIMNEVEILSGIHHRNRLRGSCFSSKIALLVFEYIPQGTLAEHLHGKTAEALDYLHTAANPPIFHRDVKCANILLDNKLNAKVADFGISKLVAMEATHVTTYAMNGTPGYMDPDIYSSFQMSAKSDACSFSVVLLELITDQAPLDRERGTDDGNLVNMSRRLFKEDWDSFEDRSILDPALRDEQARSKDDNFIVPILRTAHLALKCARQSPADRPSMKEVASGLAAIYRSVVRGKSFNRSYTKSSGFDSTHDRASSSRSTAASNSSSTTVSKLRSTSALNASDFDAVHIMQETESEIAIEMIRPPRALGARREHAVYTDCEDKV